VIVRPPVRGGAVTTEGQAIPAGPIAERPFGAAADDEVDHR